MCLVTHAISESIILQSTWSNLTSIFFLLGHLVDEDGCAQLIGGFRGRNSQDLRRPRRVRLRRRLVSCGSLDICFPQLWRQARCQSGSQISQVQDSQSCLGQPASPEWISINELPMYAFFNYGFCFFVSYCFLLDIWSNASDNNIYYFPNYYYLGDVTPFLCSFFSRFENCFGKTCCKQIVIFIEVHTHARTHAGGSRKIVLISKFN